MKKQLSDKIRLQHILDSINKIMSFTRGIDERSYMRNDLIQSAVERQIEIIGEA
jgi:uncharacterized protein with HEPN domain